MCVGNAARPDRAADELFIDIRPFEVGAANGRSSAGGGFSLAQSVDVGWIDGHTAAAVDTCDERPTYPGTVEVDRIMS